MRRNQRTAEAIAWRHLYNSKAWKQARAAQLAKAPLCERCTKLGKTTPATVVNHRTPHKGLWSVFVDPSNHESLCKPHHDQSAQQAERIGYSAEVAFSGFPTDPNHPFLKG